MKISTIDDAITLLNQVDKKIFGIGVTAYMRIMPALFLGKNFEIITYKNSLDNALLSKITKIHSLQENNEEIKKLDTNNILNSNLAGKIFNAEKEVYMLVYKTTPDIENFASKNLYTLVGNSVEKRDIYENKKEFREILEKIGVDLIRGENLTYIDFMSKEYNFFSAKYGEKIVIQLPDITVGGGLGTIFINNENEFTEFKNKIKDGIFRNTKINSLNITKFISGISSSITGCATKFGTLTSKVQTQIIDIPEVINTKKGNGVFCGHDWSFKVYSDKINKKASEMAEKIGNYMYENGYKGVFGLDLISDTENDEVYIVECNSRFTGAFPMTSLIDLKNGVIPMDIFHILEHLDIDYEIDFGELNNKYKYDKTGSHIVLSNIQDHEIIIKKDLIPGVYYFNGGEIKYLREGFGYNDIKSNDEFVIIDGNPKAGEKISGGGELSRFCHLLFPFSIIENENTLNEKAKTIINIIYKQYT